MPLSDASLIYSWSNKQDTDIWKTVTLGKGRAPSYPEDC